MHDSANSPQSHARRPEQDGATRAQEAARQDSEPAESGLTPELRAWALQQFSEEEIIDGLRELREKGGLELSEFLPQLEQVIARQ